MAYLSGMNWHIWIDNAGILKMSIDSTIPVWLFDVELFVTKTHSKLINASI